MDTVRSVDWSPTSSRLASGSRDGTARVWDTISGKTLQVFDSHNDAVNTVDWSPNGEFMVSGSSDGTVYVWDTTTGQILDSIQGTGKSVVDAEWSPTRNEIAYMYSFGSLQGATPAINIFEPLLVHEQD